MKWLLGAVFVTVVTSGLYSPVRADDKDAHAVLDKAIKALGGEEKLGKVEAATWKGRGKVTINGDDNPFSIQTTMQGLDRVRTEFEGEFNGNAVKVVTVLNGDKGWRKFGDMAMELDSDSLASTKRTVYLQLVPIT